MGKTAFSGPVYGAKSLLFGANFLLGSTGASSHLDAATVLPTYEDWYITEFAVATSTNSSVGHTWKLKSEGGSSGIFRLTLPSTVAQTIATISAGTSTSLNSLTTPTATAGEFEGVYVPAGSTLRLVSSGSVQPAAVTVQARGFIRFLNSTRAES